MIRPELGHSTILFGLDIPNPLYSLLLITAAIGMALAVHAIAARILCRIAARTATPSDDAFLKHGLRPGRWLLVGFALALIRPALILSSGATIFWDRLAGIILPALLGWLAIAMIKATQDAIFARADISVADNLRARRRRTRSAILARVAKVIILFVVICLMLLTIPTIRTIGVTLIASAGLAGLAVAAAAQPLLKNIIAGIQLAFTEPIRLDDVVIIEGEWGKIEEIHLTYVIVAVWDERRLVIPISKFIEESFQNWTRNTSQLLGSVFFYLDPDTDMNRLRARYEQIVKSAPLWDGRGQVLQVTDMKADLIEVRGLATARNAPEAFDLRCYLREQLLAFIRTEMPEAMPHHRTLLAGVPPLTMAEISPAPDHPTGYR